MNQLQAYLQLAQQRLVALPVLCLLTGAAMHNGFREGITIPLFFAALAFAGLYTILPLRFLRCTVFAPFAASLLYTTLPYVIGLSLVGATPSSPDLLWIAGLYAIGGAVVALHFYDEQPSSVQAHTTAYALRLGRDWACFICLALITLGSVLLIWQVRNALWLVAAVGLFLGAIAYIVVQLADTPKGKAEHIIIATASNLCYGLLITLLVSYILIGLGAPELLIALAAGVVTLLFLGLFFWFISHPQPLPAKHTRR